MTVDSTFSLRRRLNEWNDLKKREVRGPLSADEARRLRELTAVLSERSEELRSIVASPSEPPKAVIKALLRAGNGAACIRLEDEKTCQDPRLNGENARKIAPPRELLSNQKKWTERFKKIIEEKSGRDWATLTAKRALSSALRQMAHGKCVFCESALEVSGDLEVEHYTAKTLAPHLAFEWTNLLPACRLCNRSKGEQDHGNVAFEAGHRRPRAILLGRSRHRTPGTTSEFGFGPADAGRRKHPALQSPAARALHSAGGDAEPSGKVAGLMSRASDSTT